MFPIQGAWVWPLVRQLDLTCCNWASHAIAKDPACHKWRSKIQHAVAKTWCSQANKQRKGQLLLFFLILNMANMMCMASAVCRYLSCLTWTTFFSSCAQSLRHSSTSVCSHSSSFPLQSLCSHCSVPGMLPSPLCAFHFTFYWDWSIPAQSSDLGSPISSTGRLFSDSGCIIFPTLPSYGPVIRNWYHSCCLTSFLWDYFIDIDSSYLINGCH